MSGQGGLLSVLGPAVASREGTWVTEAITEEERAAAKAAADEGVLEHARINDSPVWLRRLRLSAEDTFGYYRRIATETLWFVHHHLFDLPRQPSFDYSFHSEWERYLDVNEQYAEVCSEEGAEGARVLVQDYHLMTTPAALRRRRKDLRISHNTQISWAAPGYFAILPEKIRRQIIEGMLGADMLGFLVDEWAQNFMSCAADLGFDADSEAYWVKDKDGRKVNVRTFPVGVDADSLKRRIEQPVCVSHLDDLRARIGDQRFVVRIERMELAKNVLRGLHGYAEFLRHNQEFHGKVLHFVLAYGSRSALDSYQRYSNEVSQLTDAINREFGRHDWQPVLLETANNPPRALAAMALADVLIVNSIRDGMNLVAKEGPIVSEGKLALVVSSGAGASAGLAPGAIIVNPFDSTELAEAIVESLNLPDDERQRRLQILREVSASLPPKQWVEAVINALDEATS